LLYVFGFFLLLSAVKEGEDCYYILWVVFLSLLKK